MFIRKLVRESTFKLARRDVAFFLEDHEEDLLKIFREEMHRLDDEIPEEATFIDIDMVGLGEVVVKAVLRALRRFLTEEAQTTAVLASKVQKMETAALSLPTTNRKR